MFCVCNNQVSMIQVIEKANFLTRINAQLKKKISLNFVTELLSSED